MKRSWFVRNFGWIRDDVRDLIEQLKRPESWVFIGMLVSFGLLAFFVVRLALRSDTLLQAVEPGVAFCRQIGDNAVAFIFVGMMFFGLMFLAMLGEFLQYIDSKRQNAHLSARSALKGTARWGLVALGIGLAILIYLDSRCG